MATLDVAKSFGVTLRAHSSPDGLAFRLIYESGREFPMFSVHVNWAKWERFVAWVELQRKEEALQEGK